MSQSLPQENPLVIDAKRQARSLETLLKEIYSDVKYMQCIDLYARFMGYQNWNTMSAMLEQVRKGGEISVLASQGNFSKNRIEEIIRQIEYRKTTKIITDIKYEPMPKDPDMVKDKLQLLFENKLWPIIKEGAKNNELIVECFNDPFLLHVIDSRDDAEDLQPKKRYSFSFHRQNDKKSNWRFDLKITPYAIEGSFGELDLYFPEDGYKAAMKLLTSDVLNDNMTPRVTRLFQHDGNAYDLTIDTFFFEEESDSGKLLWDDQATIERFKNELWSDWLAAIGPILHSHAKLAQNWSDKTNIKGLEKAIWKGFAGGDPSYTKASTEFHRATIGGITFVANIFSGGAYISSDRSHQALISASSIIKVEDEVAEVIKRNREIYEQGEIAPYKEALKPGYYIAKYGNESETKIYLKGFSEEDVKILSHEFGIEMDLYDEEKSAPVSFDTSPAYMGLQQWIKKHKRYAKKLRLL